MLLFHGSDIILCFQIIMLGENCEIYRCFAPKTTSGVNLYFSNTGGTFLHLLLMVGTAQKMKFSIKDFFGKCDQIHRKLRIWSHLLEKSLMENFIFCGVRVLEDYLKSKIKNQTLRTCR